VSGGRAVDGSGAHAGQPGLPAPDLIELPRWVAPLALLCAIGLVPWIVYLAMALPSHTRAEHYDLAWVGYDAGMLVALAALGYCAIRRSPLTGVLASVTATLLVTDAWFDVVTTARRGPFIMSVVSAAVIELPLAVLCTFVAVNAERVRRRQYRRLWQRAQAAGAVAERPAPGQRARRP